MRADVLPPLVCVCASLRRGARAVTRLYDRALSGTGLRVPQLTLLYVLSKQPDETLVQGMIAELLAIDRTTLTRTLATMARRGLIRPRASDDKRERLWSITSAGKLRLAKALPRWENVQQRLRHRIGAERWDFLIDELTHIAAATRWPRVRKTTVTPL